MFGRPEQSKLPVGAWLRVEYKGSHTAPLTLRLISTNHDTGAVPAYLDEGHAAIRIPKIPAARYWVLASSGSGEWRVGTVIVSTKG